MIAINLTAPIKLLRGFVGNMKQAQYGRIVNIGSILGSCLERGTVCLQCYQKWNSWVTNTLAVELAKV